MTAETLLTEWDTTPGGEPARVVEAIVHARGMLTALGIDCDTPDTGASPERLVKALAELTSGMHTDPAAHLSVTFPPPPGDPALIAVHGVRFSSVCEHHLLPFHGTATVAYLPAPGARIVGLSKLARLVHTAAARPQVQERLGAHIVHAIASRLHVDGAACILRGVHTCMTLRGACADGAHMTTVHTRGLLRTDPALRTELFATMHA